MQEQNGKFWNKQRFYIEREGQSTMQAYPNISEEFLRRRLRFVDGNPFADSFAEGEDQLGKYFVDLDPFYMMIDAGKAKPSSSILSAKRGAGKSANRLNASRWLKEGPPPDFDRRWPWPSKILVVPYYKFDRLKNAVDYRLEALRSRQHVDEIIRLGVEQLLNEGGRSGAIDWGKMTPSRMARLGYFLKNYSIFCLEQKNVRGEDEARSFTEVLNRACKEAGEGEYLAREGSVGLVENWLDVLGVFGFEGMVVLVDGVDEDLDTGADAEAAANMLMPLISEQRLMLHSQIFFKFFLPIEVVRRLELRRESRVGERLRYFEIEWTEDLLVERLLRTRLEAFSRNRVSTLDEFTSAEAKGAGRVLAGHSDLNPRNFLRLCEWLIYTFEEGSRWGKNKSKWDKDQLIKTEMVDRAIGAYYEERMRRGEEIASASLQAFVGRVEASKKGPGSGQEGMGEEAESIGNEAFLEITDQFMVRYQGEIISSQRLTRKELELLRYFINNPGRVIPHDVIGAAVWKEKWDNRYLWTLTSTVNRLRQKIGKERGFIETAVGIGYLYHPSGVKG